MNNIGTKKLSVIVAVYNTEQYLKKCLDSILCQNYSIEELIVINDGSTDNSGKICDEYAQAYSNVKVIHQKNAGQMAALMTGLSYASAEYVSFVDSDDWIEVDYFNTLMKATDNLVDAVYTNVYQLDYGSVCHDQKSHLECGLYTKEDIENVIAPVIFQDEIIGEKSIFAYMPGKIFRCELLKESVKDIDLRIRLGQDGAVVFPFSLAVNSIRIISCKGYHYVQREGSISRNPDFNFFKELYVLKDYLTSKFMMLNSDKNVVNQVNVFIRYLLVVAVRNIYNIEMGRILCVPPYEIINKNEKLVIYGAGLAGQSFVRQILHSDYAAIVGWVDKNIRDEQYGIRIESPEVIKDMEFDQILIAVTEPSTASKIKDYIINMGVPAEKIIWKEIYWG